jgi:hypothetical protein
MDSCVCVLVRGGEWRLTRSAGEQTAEYTAEQQARLGVDAQGNPAVAKPTFCGGPGVRRAC